MLQEISNPFGILDIRFATRNVPHVAGIDNNGRQGGKLENVIERLPVRSRAFHGNHLAFAVREPFSEGTKFLCRSAKLTDFLLLATFQSGNHNSFVHINPTATFVQRFHEVHLQLYDVAPMIRLFYFTSSKEQNVVQKGARSVYYASSRPKKESTLQRLTIFYHSWRWFRS